jgi:alcohol dehydrogenase class IV
MNLISLNLPNIITTNNFTDGLLKIIKGKNCLLFTSKFWAKNKVLNRLKKSIKLVDIIYNIGPNPQLNDIIKTNLNLEKIDFIICLGGGSVIDYTKAVVAFNSCNNNQEYFKKTLNLNQDFDLKNTPKIIAIPSTSGTGSELNHWGTVWDNKKKYSVSGRKLLPLYIILDASLCVSMPKPLTVSSGLDALSHAFESVWNTNNNKIVDELSKIAIKKIIKNLPLVIKNGRSIKLRKEMQLASFFAGIAMSKTKTAICHSISYPLTSIFGLPHGIACSLTLSEVSRLITKQNKERAKIISEAMECSCHNLELTIINFLKSINYGNYLKSLENVHFDESINFINPVRAKNSLVDVTNRQAIKMINSAILKFIK